MINYLRTNDKIVEKEKRRRDSIEIPDIQDGIYPIHLNSHVELERVDEKTNLIGWMIGIGVTVIGIGILIFFKSKKTTTDPYTPTSYLQENQNSVAFSGISEYAKQENESGVAPEGLADSYERSSIITSPSSWDTPPFRKSITNSITYEI